MVGMQATTLLQGTYVARVSASLQEKEKKDKGKKNILFGDGMLRVVSDQEFVDMVKQKEAEAEKSRQKGHYTIAFAEWKAEAGTARKEKRKLGWTKPKRGNIEKGEPHPKYADFKGEEEVNTTDDDSNVDEVARDDEAELD
ncbi:hypothetical protein EYR40_007429 [Pleurotus pulmonarius]|nr:hypothetical protein EYR40_007429 [Pleurotus pulmonarius]